MARIVSCKLTTIFKILIDSKQLKGYENEREKKYNELLHPSKEKHVEHCDRSGPCIHVGTAEYPRNASNIPGSLADPGPRPVFNPGTIGDGIGHNLLSRRWGC